MSNKNPPILRIRGKAFQKNSKWAYEIVITVGSDDGKSDIIMTSPEDALYLSQTSAINAMKAAIPDIMNECCKAMGMPEPDGVLNLKEGVQQSMDDFAKPESYGGGS